MVPLLVSGGNIGVPLPFTALGGTDAFGGTTVSLKNVLYFFIAICDLPLMQQMLIIKIIMAINNTFIVIFFKFC
jgi:hypothetical protein